MLNITIEKTQGRKDVYGLCIDDEHWRDFHAQIFGRKPVFKATTDLVEFEQYFLELEYKSAFHYALKRLAFKAQPSSELEKALAERLVSPSVIQRILLKCQEMGYINDSEWIAAFIRQQQAKNRGKQAIAAKLRLKGISEKDYSPLLHAADAACCAKEQIRKLLQTRYKSRNLLDYKEKQKVIAGLMRRGFSLTDIYPTIGSLDDFDV